jgi:hypothetical protein
VEPGRVRVEEAIVQRDRFNAAATQRASRACAHIDGLPPRRAQAAARKLARRQCV